MASLIRKAAGQLGLVLHQPNTVYNSQGRKGSKIRVIANAYYAECEDRKLKYPFKRALASDEDAPVEHINVPRGTAHYAIGV